MLLKLTLTLANTSKGSRRKKVDNNEIKELMIAMEEQGIHKLSIKKENGFELQLERAKEELHNNHERRVEMAPRELPRPYKATLEEAKEVQMEMEGYIVTSPMVGTLYLKPSPDDPPFVQVGDKVKEDTVVCIIEAMKVMNEVKAGKAGTIAEVLIDNAHPVEFGSKLFRIV